MSNLTVKGITPDLSILGSYQRFSFNDVTTSLQLKNSYAPTASISPQTNFEFYNGNLSGFRWIHKTTSTDTQGTYTLQSFVTAQNTGTDIFRINNDNSITFLTTVSGISGGGGSVTLTGAVTGSGSGTINTTLSPITTSQISNFSTSVTAFRLDQFAVPTASVNMNNQKITNLSTPTATTDAVNKSYVDGKTWTASQISDFTSAVTAFRLNQFAAPNGNIDLGGGEISFGSTIQNRKLILYPGTGDHTFYGLGVNGSVLRYQVPVGCMHIFYQALNSSASTVLMSIGSQVGIGTSAPDQTLSVNGNASKVGGGSWATFSDARIKAIDGEYTRGLTALMEIIPKIYRYTTASGYAEKELDIDRIGLIAQEIEEIIPECITTQAVGEIEDMRIYDSTPILYMLINAVKELNTRLINLEQN